MDESQLINMFANGTYNWIALRGKTFDVEIVAGFVDLGFSDCWVKVFSKTAVDGYNKLSGHRFGDFKVKIGLWSGYECVLLDYGVGFVSVKDYMRQIDGHTWLGVYVVGGHLKGWFRLREVKK